MYRIAVEREFDMAHIVETDSKCGRIHGHRWKLIVEVKSDKLRDDGMILDFTKLKSVIDKAIVDVLDHKILVPSRFAEGHYIKGYGVGIKISINNKEYIVPKEDTVILNIDNSTSECIVKKIYEILSLDSFICQNNNFRISKIVLYETPTSYAEYVPEDKNDR